MDLQDKAERLLEQAGAILENDSLPQNKRERDYCHAMQRFCTVQAQRYTDDPRWQTQAQEWSKRKQVALKALADDELSELRALIERLQSNSIRLDEV